MLYVEKCAQALTNLTSINRINAFEKMKNAVTENRIYASSRVLSIIVDQFWYYLHWYFRYCIRYAQSGAVVKRSLARALSCTARIPPQCGGFVDDIFSLVWNTRARIWLMPAPWPDTQTCARPCVFRECFARAQVYVCVHRVVCFKVSWLLLVWWPRAHTHDRSFACSRESRVCECLWCTRAMCSSA